MLLRRVVFCISLILVAGVLQADVIDFAGTYHGTFQYTKQCSAGAGTGSGAIDIEITDTAAQIIAGTANFTNYPIVTCQADGTPKTTGTTSFGIGFGANVLGNQFVSFPMTTPAVGTLSGN